MTNLFKYRKLGIVLLIAMIVSFLMSIVALWNFALKTEAKNGGWIFVFVLLVFGTGLAMFFLVYRLSDHAWAESYVESLLQEENAVQTTGKEEVLEDTAAREKVHDEPTIEQTADQILSAIQAVNPGDFCDQLLTRTCNQLEFVQGICYLKEKRGKKFLSKSTYALNGKEIDSFEKGDGIRGEAVESKQMIRINDIPVQYFDVASGLGNAKPRHVLFVPITYRNQGIGLIEAGTFVKPEEITEKILQQIADKSGKILHDLMSR